MKSAHAVPTYSRPILSIKKKEATNYYIHESCHWLQNTRQASRSACYLRILQHPDIIIIIIIIIPSMN
jgi:uncharacterized ParB-like nuclease family protein